jgi:RHS repeat-associated protein
VIAEIDRNGAVHYYLPNHRGDTVLCVTNNGMSVSYLRYDAFGNCVTNIGAFNPRYTFSTKEYLSAVELYLYAYRLYDPVAGRWTQRDPVDYQDSVNLYQFCGNNPVNGIDEYGLILWEQLGKGISAMSTGGGMIGFGIALACVPTGGITQGAGVLLVVAGHYPVITGGIKTIGALMDKEVDIPATPGDFAEVGLKKGIDAMGYDSDSVPASISSGALGLTIDSIISGGLGSIPGAAARAAQVAKYFSLFSDVVGGSTEIIEESQKIKENLKEMKNEK